MGALDGEILAELKGIRNELRKIQKLQKEGLKGPDFGKVTEGLMKGLLGSPEPRNVTPKTQRKLEAAKPL